MNLSFGQVEQYRRDGYLLVDNVFSPEEVQRMIEEVDGGEGVVSSISQVNDTKGNKVRLAFWDNLTDDIWSRASSTWRIVNSIRILQGEEISFYHGKVAMKEAYTGGAFEWHQDYGYWYNGGFMYPNMISAFVALDPSTKENGCLRVLRGSHKLGRLTHVHANGQTMVEPERMEMLESRLETVYCEMQPGSVLFFDCNTLHTSAANQSNRHRRSFIVCYNALSNTQVYKGEVIERGVCPVDASASILDPV
ncbi:phytanoyl-CoA dioxygenase family protein [Paenibacillus montanisoli]|uniref:Phytanoyl-CoA dioxygenase family protein n=1 Tax=Paenibacillus montanisoli TaxID=2081970 RepID=A0A328U582_9BACL|nr:phytanoyl-CoA dioxygenase family protein [Paenibacillus montanisoli]RAP76571.1 phytanoyl-CoA dioxygenase family protein [Paenibacillus montanisoli]